jgi:hypothetical protein
MSSTAIAAGIPAEPASLNVRSELAFLHKDAGFTPARVAKAPLVRQLLGGDNETFDAMRERLISAINLLRDPEPEILLDVFGFLPETEHMVLLKDRRKHYGDRHGIKIEAVFLGEKPRNIWSYRGLTFFERPGSPSTGEPLEFDGESVVKTVFHDLYGGLFSGIAWEW